MVRPLVRSVFLFLARYIALLTTNQTEPHYFAFNSLICGAYRYPDQAIEDTLDELGTDIPTITSTLAPDMDEGLADGSYQDTAYQQTGYVDENTGLYYPDETGNEVDDWNHGGPHGEWPNGELEDTSGVYFGNSEGGGEGGNDEVGNGMYFDEETGDM